jgi:transcriptional regulator with XRE-family HTH domain
LNKKANLDQGVEPVLAEDRSFSGGAGEWDDRDDLMARNLKIIRDRAFAQRFARACDANSRVPLLNHGRLTWLQRQLEDRFGIKASLETIRRWMSGEMKPRANKLAALAKVLEVDEAWLSIGTSADATPRDVKVRNAMAAGSVNVLAGLVQMAGGTAAFPESDDTHAEKLQIHLYSIIRGAQYAFHVVLGRRDEAGNYRFTMPDHYEQIFVVGAVPTDGPCVKYVEFPTDWVTANAARSRTAGLEMVLNEAEIDARRIRSFADRL